MDTMDVTADSGAEAAPFGLLVRRHRRALGLSQEALAERAGISPRSLSEIERGGPHRPRRDTLALLAEALGLDAAQRAVLERALPRRAPPPAPVAPALGADAGATAPPASPAADTPAWSNLPRALSSFIGRECELGEARTLLETARLVTLSGAGGVGKTRLALAVAAELEERKQYADGVWLVELAALADPTLVPGAVARALGLREQPVRPLLDTLADALRSKRLLLVLDNCEHLLAACAALAGALLRACSGLCLLATSREGLGLAGEQLYRVPSLGVPDPRHPPPPEQAGRFEAVRLFAARARERRPDFILTAQNARTVAQVCARLDGLPLAIELAAARVGAMSVQTIAARLDDRFALLTGGARDALPRQQTLRATLDWSCELLGAGERVLLGRLSVFAGGWTLEAAEAVCVGDGLAAEEVLDLLGGLVDKSLVQADEREGAEVRYRLLETVRWYGYERLVIAGEAEQVRDRHLDWCLALVQQAAPALFLPGQAVVQGQVVWLERLETELENLRLALAWAATGVAQQERGVQLVESAGIWWYLRGHGSEARRWLEDLLDRGDPLAPVFRARALLSLGMLAGTQGDDRRALGLHETAYALFVDQGDQQRAATALQWQGLLAVSLGDRPHGATLLREALRRFQELGDRGSEGWTRSNLGYIAHLRGDYAGATAHYQDSLAQLREVGDTWGIGNQLTNLANVARDLGDVERAGRLHRESLAVRIELQDQPGFMGCFEGLAVVAAGQGQPERAARLFGAAEGGREAIGCPVDLADRVVHERTVGAVRAALGEGAFAAACAAGRALTMEQAIAYALEQPAGG